MSELHNTCPNCGRDTTGKLHCSVDGNDYNFCDELCVISYSRKFPKNRIVFIEGFCQHGDDDYSDYLEICNKCGNVREAR